ncbi:MAG: membrane protein insertase YidC [Bacteroides sp.]|nr:membrane protein insertase YidC [Bacteroides sp.]MCM1095176.1 membrane protein insertase YidC [Terasakiella sp.]
MDKNTLWGIVMMAAIFFGFMYCNKPAQDNTPTPAEQAAAAAVTSAIAPADSIDAAASAELAKAVRNLGTSQPDGSYVLADEAFDLRLDSLTVRGTVRVGENTVSVDDLRTTAGSTLRPAERAKAMEAVGALIAKVQKYRGFARHLGGKETTTVLENERLRLDISSRGGMIAGVTLKDYTTEVGEQPGPIQLMQGDNDGYSFTFTTADQRLDTREFNFTPVVESDSTVLMTLALGDGAEWGIRYTLRPDSYVVGMEVVQRGMDAVLPASTSSIDMNWRQTLARNEKGRTFEERNSAVYYKYVGEGPDDLRADKDDSEQLTSRVQWVAFKNQFFSSVIIPRDAFSLAEVSSTVLKTDRYLKDMSMSATVPCTAADGAGPAFDFYFGPNDYPMLSSLSKDLAPRDGDNLELTRLIPLGWGLFRYINTWIVIPVFTFLSSFISSYGLIILLLTLFIKLIIFPFTYKSFKSQAKMRVLQPEIKEINDKYPGQENAMKRQQETMALYSRCGASPFSGCLPMLFQMPVLIAMFSFFPSAIELRGESFLWAHDLSAPDFIVTLPFSIPFYGNGVSLFCLLMTVVNILYMRINMQNQPGGDSMPGMKLMMYMMPVMFLFIFNDYASGLSYYYFLSLLITIVQTWAFRHFMDEGKVREQLLANARKPRKKSGLMARLQEAQRQQEAMMRQQQAARGKGGKRR